MYLEVISHLICRCSNGVWCGDVRQCVIWGPACVGVDERCCVGFPDGAAPPSLRPCYRWLFGSAERQCRSWSTTPGIAEQPIILPFFPFTGTLTNSPDSRAAWRTERTWCTRRSWPSRRRDTTVRRRRRASHRGAPLPLSLPAQGAGAAGRAAHMEVWGGETKWRRFLRQNESVNV